MRIRNPTNPPQQAADLEQLQPMQNQNAMLDACEAGDLPKLQHLFRAAGVRQGDAAFEPFFGEPVPATGPPPTAIMITAAVACKQPTIVAFILATYRSFSVDRSSILEAVLTNPHRTTLEVLHARTPSILNFEFQETHTTLLMEACRTPEPDLPSWLLGLGADPSECDFAGTGPLLYAVKFGQPFDVLVMMVERGAIVTGPVIDSAIARQSLEILKFLLDRARLDRPKDTLAQAQETGNKRIINLVYERTKKGEKSPLKRRRKKGTSFFEFEQRVESTKWWQFGR